MSGQTFQENIEQDLDGLLSQHFDGWPPGTTALHSLLVEWAVKRFSANESA